MLFRQLFDRESSTYTYLIAEDYGRDAIIIDPVKQNADRYITLITELNLKLVAALDTHLHADHITALGTLRNELNCMTMMGIQSNVDCVTHYFHDDEFLEFDGIKIRTMYTPGHTDNSYCFVMDDRVFTGDTLLIRGTGRTDFQNGSASSQYDSIFNGLFTLPDNTLVYPGHDYNGMTVSTIVEEKKYNPRLQVKTRNEYIKLMGGLNLPHPKLIDVAIPANKQCGFG